MAAILVVEDEEHIRKVVALQLELEGHQVEVSSCGEECLKRLRSKLPRLVILDYLLPDYGGEEIVRLLRGLDGGEKIPVVLLSGLEREDLDRELLEDPQVFFLAKPFDNRDLLELVKIALGAR